MGNDLTFTITMILLPLAAGYIFGRWNERRHYKSILRREADLRHLIAFALRHIPDDIDAHSPHLVMGSAVISVDYFKSFLAGFRNIFGGKLSSYETLLERGRREAILRMKQNAKDLGADIVYNVRLETSPVFGSGAQNVTRSIEVMAYGTAIEVGALRRE